MSDSMSEAGTGTVMFGDKLISSSAFKVLFREGMALVEETAAYLDGPGREESRGLVRAPIRVAGASGSKRAVVRHTLDLYAACRRRFRYSGRRRWPFPRRIPRDSWKERHLSLPHRARSPHLVGRGDAEQR